MIVIKKKSKYRGFSLVELLVGIVVLGILSTAMVFAGSSAQTRARVTKATVKFDNYATAFSETVMSFPGIMKDREEAWAKAVKAGKPYSTKDGMQRLVIEMNKLLDPDDQFVWGGDEFGYECYVSVGLDPWGGHYILTEYPQASDTDLTRYDLTSPTGNPYRASMCCSIWVEGPDHGIVEGKIGADSRGMTMEYLNGECRYLYHNVGVANTDGTESPYNGYKITVK